VYRIIKRVLLVLFLLVNLEVAMLSDKKQQALNIRKYFRGIHKNKLFVI